jgi:glutathione S-transferase
MPTLFVCHGDDGGPSFHPCRQAQEALRSAGIEYRKVIAAHGSPLPFLRGPRPELLRETGTDKLPTLKLADGAVLIDVPAIRRWISEGAK